ncbi:unnamed protein product [Bemisia tabaci]|uniref:PID domain-containing protein n=1 Tax=Bemisia tabaci TaxID=7038 RepID=A0A9P0A0X8_BEMTA|nr:PREDICTED: PTB domain-containing engulfment adapter protein 1 [Bemisia tabaci]CAH0381687.1 unnamed protein product [Bemisia tabaci]
MRNSNLLKWAQSMNNKQSAKNGKTEDNRNWIHPPDTLQRGHIAYLVKFLGSTEVDQPKGIEVVKEGIRKLKFNQHLKKSEGSSKIPKVELTISVDGVAIQEPKTKRILYQYPLHRISYCADDKGEKRFFSFIAKESAESEQHTCFVFVSDKLAEEITLTIGQAFDLAYKRFLELEAERKVMVLSQRVKRLETENSAFRERLSDVISYLEGHPQLQEDLQNYMRRNNITNMLEVSQSTPSNETNSSMSSPQNSQNVSQNGTQNGSQNGSQNGYLLLLNFNDSNNQTSPPPVPPRAFQNQPFEQNDLISNNNFEPAVGTKLEGLLLDELDDDFNPRAYETVGDSSAAQNQTGFTSNGNLHSPPPLLAPPPKTNRDTARRSNPPNNFSKNNINGASMNGGSEDVFGLTPFNNNKMSSASLDPFGMADFSNQDTASNGTSQHNDMDSAMSLLDKRILEMKDGFSRGLSMCTEDFSIESLDPLRK